MYIQDQTIKKLKNHRTLEEETAKPPHAHLGKKKKKKSFRELAKQDGVQGWSYWLDELNLMGHLL